MDKKAGYQGNGTLGGAEFDSGLDQGVDGQPNTPFPVGLIFDVSSSALN